MYLNHGVNAVSIHSDLWEVTYAALSIMNPGIYLCLKPRKKDEATLVDNTNNWLFYSLSLFPTAFDRETFSRRQLFFNN